MTYPSCSPSASAPGLTCKRVWAGGMRPTPLSPSRPQSPPTRCGPGRGRCCGDAGLVALAAGDYPRAAERLAIALADIRRLRPSLSLARAEALARARHGDAAAEQLRAALTEPVGRADQPWSLVPRVSGVQALIALARGESEQARHYLDEAAAWSRLLPHRDHYTSEGYLAGLLDLGKPPVVGLVEPAKELAKITAERDRLTADGQRRS